MKHKEPTMKATWVSKRGCQESLFQRASKHQQRKRQQRRERLKKPNNSYFPKGVDGQKPKKRDGILKWRTKGKREK